MIPYHPILYLLESPIKIPLWSTLLAVGCLAALLVMVREAKIRKIPSEDVIKLWICITLGGFVGMKLFSNLMGGRTGIDALNIFGTGSASMGAGAGIIIGIYIFSRAFKRDLWQFADIAVIGVAIGGVFTKIGCHLSGDIDAIGRPTEMPWAIMSNGIASHPTALYATIYLLVIFIVLLYLRKKAPFDGFLFLMFIILYCACRLLFENTFRQIGVDIDLWYALLPIGYLTAALTILIWKARKKALSK